MEKCCDCGCACSNAKDLNVAVNDALVNTALGKKWYESKTFWVNVIAAGALAVQMKYGFIIGPEMQALGLTAVNLVLRKLTKSEVTFF